MPVYFSHDAFDPSVPIADLKLLTDTVRTRDGVAGVIPEGSRLRCPYTGAEMAARRVEGGFALCGGFSPRHPVSDPEALARAFLMRDGKLPKGVKAPKPAPVVSVSKREPVEASAPVKAPELSEDALRLVDPLARAAVSPGVTITVPEIPKASKSKKSKA